MAKGDGAVDFLQRLLRVRSLPGEEGDVAKLVRLEMEALGFDEVGVDAAGNVIGHVRGGDRTPGLMLNTHLDHVEAGDPDRWPVPPFGGEVRDGRVWGRGAVDIKGPLAAQVYGAASVLQQERPPADVWVTAVVQEEIGGLGARHLATHMGTDLVVVGEPSSNELRRGHRGRAELEVRVGGRSAHASMPAMGRNPLPSLGRFLARLDSVDLPDHPDLGTATLVPTRVTTEPASSNVVPGEARLTCDARVVPGQSVETLRHDLEELLAGCLETDLEGSVEIPTFRRTSYAGLEMEMPADNPPFLLPEEHPALRCAAKVLTRPLGAPPPVGLWRFATDGGHFAEAGMTVVGFGPGDEELAHTVDESIDVAELERAVEAYAGLVREWPAAVAAL
jgi:putative selenium metabolism hydrolase